MDLWIELPALGVSHGWVLKPIDHWQKYLRAAGDIIIHPFGILGLS
jgi:hypothetical protein